MRCGSCSPLPVMSAKVADEESWVMLMPLPGEIEHDRIAVAAPRVVDRGVVVGCGRRPRTRGRLVQPAKVEAADTAAVPATGIVREIIGPVRGARGQTVRRPKRHLAALSVQQQAVGETIALHNAIGGERIGGIGRETPGRYTYSGPRKRLAAGREAFKTTFPIRKILPRRFQLRSALRCQLICAIGIARNNSVQQSRRLCPERSSPAAR